MTLLLMIAIIHPFGTENPEDAGNSHKTLASAVHDAFVSNKSSFVNGSISFEVARGVANNADEALHGAAGPYYAGIGKYKFSKYNYLYELHYETEDLIKSSKFIDGSAISILESYRMCTDGNATLYDSISASSASDVIRGIKLVPGAETFDKYYQFPLSLGRPSHPGVENLGFYLQKAISGDSNIKIETIDSQTLNGVDAMHIKLRTENGFIEYWVDLEHGAVPMKIVDWVAGDGIPSHGYRTIRLFDDIRLARGRGWLPYRESEWHASDNTSIKTVIKEANFDDPPAREEFSLSFDKPVSIVDQMKGLRYPPSKSWNLASLPSRGAPGVEKVQYTNVPESSLPSFPGERAGRGIKWYMTIGAVASVPFIIAAVMIWRKQA